MPPGRAGRRAARARWACGSALLALVPLCLAAPAAVASAGHNPIGHLDLVYYNAGPPDAAGYDAEAVSVAGWAADPDAGSRHVQVVLTTDGATPRAIVGTGLPRPDVQRAYPPFGPTAGFYAQLDVAPGRGTHTVCAVAINQEPGANTLIGCRHYTVPPWFPGALAGHIDFAYKTPSGVVAVGWALDPYDAESPTPFALADKTLNDPACGCASSWVYGLSAGLPRPDVDRVFPRNGTHHGFVVTIPTSAIQGYTPWNVGDTLCLALDGIRGFVAETTACTTIGP